MNERDPLKLLGRFLLLCVHRYAFCLIRFPALWAGLHLLVGSAAAFGWHFSYLFVIAALWIVSGGVKRILAGTGIALAAFFYTLLLYPPLEMQKEKEQGVAHFSISAIKEHASSFGSSFVYQGMIKEFEGKRALPCQIFLSKTAPRPIANQDYLIRGTLIQKEKRSFVFKPAKNTPWEPVRGTWSLAEGRHLTKEKVCRYIKTKISHPRSATFLAALATGEIEEHLLSLEFSKVGLQHILAISGFHFGLLAAFLGFFCRLIIPRKWTALILLLALSGYFFFIGNAPSVQRAWIAISLVLIGTLCNLRTSGLNALGVALILEICLDPLLITQIGFQLSFLCTFAILQLFPVVDKFLGTLLPKRTLRTASGMNFFNQHGYVLSALTRKALSLNLAVHLAALLPTLYLFHKFPWLSFLYNLFFPFCVSISVLLLLLALFFSLCLPPLASLLYKLCSFFTAELLDLTSHPPAFFDASIHLPTLPFWVVILFLSLLFLLSFHPQEAETGN